ncbi:MAG TPA: hypothetical protein VE567_08640 [Sphingomonas sp.]|nr:hypothetical protein [Sphingomonas sp.]
MKMNKWLGVAVAALLASGPAAAQGASEDVRCLLAANLFAKSEKDPAKQQIARFSAYYFLGRVDARLSGSELMTSLKSQGSAITAQTAGPIMTSCAKRVQSAGMAIQTLGRQAGTK